MSFPCSRCPHVDETLAGLYAHISTMHPEKPRPTDKPSPPGPKPWDRKKKK